MTLPIRGSIHVLTELPDEPEDMTIRQAIEWFKKVVRSIGGDITPLERKELDATWAYLARGIAKREDIPDGSLSYFMGELAQTEMRLADMAASEAHDAGIDYQQG